MHHFPMHEPLRGQVGQHLHTTPDPDAPNEPPVPHTPPPVPVPDDVPDPVNAPVEEPRMPEPPIRAH